MQVLADVIECDTQERPKLLAESCAGDELLRQEIERLMKHEKEASRFLEESLVELPHHHQLEAERSLVGKQIGSYRITGVVGNGGMGAVYRAIRADDEFQRQVAIKLIKPGMDTTLILRRFRHERQILANLDHQNIARLFDGGSTEEGSPYLVMEYVEGLPIHDFANSNNLSITERLKLFLGVCEAVEYAHRHQVVHSDLKPANILVTKEGLPKLLDFGIARVLYPDQVNVTSEFTHTALGGMTPEYASPEQVRGEKVTTASDVYSLGVLLYELLTGQRPYSVRNASPYEIAHIICEAEPQNPSKIVTHVSDAPVSDGGKRRTAAAESFTLANDTKPAELRRRLAGDLDTIVLMALKKEPERRYASVEDFAADIRRHLAGLSILARKDNIPYRITRFLKRNRVYALMTSLIAVSCLVVGVSLALVTTNARQPKSVGVMPFVNLSQDPNTEYLCDGLTDNLITQLSRRPNLRVPAHSSVFSYKGRDPDISKIGRALQVDTLLTGTVDSDGETLVVYASLIDVKTKGTIWSARYQRKSTQLLVLQREMVLGVEQNLGISSAGSEGKQPPKNYTNDDEAYRLYLRGTYFWNMRTESGLIKAKELYQQAIDRDPGYALANDGLAKSYALLGAYTYYSAESAFPPAKAAAVKALQLDPNLAEAHTTLALINWLYDWNWQSADDEFRRARDLDPQCVTAHHWYGLYLSEMGRAEESIIEEKRALDLDPVSLPIAGDLGRVYFFARRYDEALQQYQTAIQMGPDWGAFYVELQYVYEQKGMIAEWFAMMDQRQLADNATRKAVQAQDWKKYLGIRAQVGSPHDRAEYYARLGDKNNAFAQLELTYQQHDHRMSQLRVNPVWDPLRSDPRFLGLLRRMNLQH